MKPHKHAETIKAWADGAEIEWREQGDVDWKRSPGRPAWSEWYEYRVKPKDISVTLRLICLEGGGWILSDRGPDNLRVTMDGATGKLKSAEVL